MSYCKYIQPFKLKFSAAYNFHNVAPFHWLLFFHYLYLIISLSIKATHFPLGHSHFNVKPNNSNSLSLISVELKLLAFHENSVCEHLICRKSISTVSLVAITLGVYRDLVDYTYLQSHILPCTNF